MRRSWLGCVLFLLSACGSDNKKIPVAPGNGSTDAGPYIGEPDKPDAGSDPLAPRVEFTSPGAATNPNEDAVVTVATLTVTCKVQRALAANASAVDKSSVKITLDQPTDPTKQIASPVNALANDEYQAIFELAALPNGLLHFHCSAKDTSTTPHTTNVTLDTMLDLGPTIEILSPKKQVNALKTPVSVEFKVSEAALGEEDQEHKIKDVTLLVAGVETAVAESTTTPGLFQASVDFDDRNRYPVPPSAAQLTFRASSSRTPAAPVREAKLNLTIDGAGPVIKVEKPGDGQIVGDDQDLTINVTDASGVRASSIVADIGNGLAVIKDWSGTLPTLTAKMSTGGPVFRYLTQVPINITASDTVGNQTTVALTVKLDNLPPIISLDPPKIQEWRLSNGALYCSNAFDPVGARAPSDLDDVVNWGYFRALVEDQTNRPLGNPNAKVYISGTKADEVMIFAQPRLDVPLLIDTGNDGTCDEINELKNDNEKFATSLKLSPVNPTGSAYFQKLPAMPDVADCRDPGGAVTPPITVCNSSEMMRVIPGRIDSKPPAVYAIRPSNSGSAGECTGEYWELLTIANEGWLCIAARAKDAVGNIGVSRPLRVCWDDPRTSYHPRDVDPKTGKPLCDMDNVPSCTDGCTFTAAQEFSYTDSPKSWYWP